MEGKSFHYENLSTIKVNIYELTNRINQLESLKGKETELTDQINRLNREIEESNKNTDTLTNENEKLKNQIKQLKDLKGKDGEYEKEIEKLKNEIEGLNKKIDTLKNENTEEPEILAKQGNSIGMKFTQIPAGEFYMGSEEYDNEKPVHRVKINNPFYLGTYPVTRREWKAVMGNNNNSSNFKGDDLPVEQVSWEDVQKFIKKLNGKEGTDKYRLPSEAEWEYACRAGTTTRYSFSDDESKLGDYGWYDKNSEGNTHPVGQRDPNSWLLYDMHGNVWEWVQDEWHDSYDDDAPTDGSAWESGDGANRVIRGGSWRGNAGNCRSASRYHFDSRIRYDVLGFRLLREV
jgi:formylglycine-generating enzyme required for sulfatase activity